MQPPSLKKPKPCPMEGDRPAWAVRLGQAGLPSKVVVLDFETFFDDGYSMGGTSDKALSTIEYVQDERYEEIGKAVIEIRTPFAPIQPAFWRGDDDTIIRHLQREYGPNFEKATVVAQNAAFDCLLLSRKYGIHPPHIIDLLGLARHEESRDRNDLGSLAERYNLPPKGNTADFKGLRLASMTPEQYGAMAKYAMHDAWLEWHLFTYLMPRLSRPKVEAAIMQHTLELFLKPTLEVDQEFAVTLAGKMEAKIDEVVSVTGETRDAISGNKTFGVLLGKALDDAGDKVANYQKMMKKGPMLAIAQADPQLELLQAHKSPRVRELMAARTAIKSWPLHIARVNRIARQARAAGGPLPVPLKYHGAHTGRASGGERINLQNLSSRGDELTNSIRQLLVAPEGHSLVIVDASAVEARGTSWIAGQEDLNELFRLGKEVYCEYAGRMAGRSLRKARKSDPPPLAQYLTRMRNMGKVQVLGCGYGMGADKCVAFASSSYGVDLTLAEAVNLVQSYRNSVPKICKFWRVIEQKFKAAARYGEPGVMERGLKFHKEDDITIITLPSGRTLKYPGVRISIVNGKEQMWMPDPMKPGHRTAMWGGFLTENVVQAFCRDMLMDAMLVAEEKGYHTALHVHDELVAVVPDAKADQALKDIIKIMSTPPAWAPDIPLAAEGHVSKRYGK